MSGPDKTAISKPPRELACSRCRRRKKRCNKVRPVCGECQKAGAECLSVGTHKAGKFATVPVVYLESLEARVAELEGALHNPPTQGSQSPDAASVCYAPPSPPRSRTSPDARTDSHFPYDSAVSDFGAEESSPVHQRQPSLSRRATFDVGFKSLFETGDDVFASLVPQDNSPFVIEYYANVYFTNVHLPWPCLDKEQWVGWYKSWNQSDTEDQRWKGFFLDMVYSIGALYCSAFDKSSPHRLRARSFYKRAISNHQYTMRQPSAMLRAKASLLLTLFTLHGPSAGDLYGQVTTAMLHCTHAIDEEKRRAHELSDAEKETNKLAFMTCHNLNEIIAQGWERPASFMYGSVEKKFYEKLDAVVSSPMSSALNSSKSRNTKAFDHVFDLRRLRSKARLAKRNDAGEELYRDKETKLRLRKALDEWKAQIPLFEDPSAYSEYYGAQWMSHLYDYALVDLLHAPFSALTEKDTQELLAAACETCRTFISCREEKHITCYTWTALVYQFRAGITILYCLWALSRNAQLPLPQQTIHTAIYACSKTLTQFAMRWDDAVVYRDIFNLLARNLSLQQPQLSTSEQNQNEAKLLLRELRRLHTHRPVLRMIEEMCFQNQPSQPETPATYPNPSIHAPMTTTMSAMESDYQNSIMLQNQQHTYNGYPNFGDATDTETPFQDMLGMDMEVSNLGDDFLLGVDLGCHGGLAIDLDGGDLQRRASR